MINVVILNYFFILNNFYWSMPDYLIRSLVFKTAADGSCQILYRYMQYIYLNRVIVGTLYFQTNVIDTMTQQVSQYICTVHVHSSSHILYTLPTFSKKQSDLRVHTYKWKVMSSGITKKVFIDLNHLGTSTGITYIQRLCDFNYMQLQCLLK